MGLWQEIRCRSTTSKSAWPSKISIGAKERARPTPSEDHHGLPTPRSTLRAGYLDVLCRCKACRHRAEADLQKLVDEGRGDTPLINLRYRCSKTDWVVTSKYGRRPAWNCDGERWEAQVR